MSLTSGTWIIHAKKALREIVADPSRISDDPEVLISYLEPGNEFPNLFAVVFPRSVEEVKLILSCAGSFGFSICTPLPWGLNPPRLGCVLDFRFMNRILSIDERNLFMEIEPGVTWEQALDALKNLNIRIALPAAAMSPYVLDYAMNMGVYLSSVTHKTRQIATFHAILADGRDYRSGSDALPTSTAHWREDGGPNISKVFFGSWNTFGIVVGAFLYLYPRFEARKVLQFGFNTIDGALKVAARISRGEIPLEIAVLSRSRALMKAGISEEGENHSPPWVMLLGLEGTEILVSYYEKRTLELIESLGISTMDVPKRISEKLDSSLVIPWYSGRFSLGFYTNLRSAKRFYYLVRDKLKRTGELSLAVIPISGGASCFMHFEIINPAEDFERIIKPFLRRLADEGAFFPAPTGPLASHILGKQPEYKNLVKSIKEVLDPLSILNAGQILEV